MAGPETPSRSNPEGSSTRTPVAPGTRLGRYELLEVLGRGAMGTVYVAHDPRIERKVAIKTLRGLDQLADADRRAVRARFLLEARAAGRLAHPGVLTIYDVGEEQDVPYIAMELLEGQPLEAHTRVPNLLPVPTVLSLIQQACEALSYAHAAGVIHRDIKPANLMLLPDGMLKITDFGLAKTHDASLTTDGSLLGTPYYMSPEQIRGETLDGRSDLFSLGAVLYQLLTGDLPFPGDTIHTVIHRILTDPPGDSRADGRVTDSLREILHRALEKNREARFATGAELGAAIHRVLIGLERPSAGELLDAPGMRRPSPERSDSRRIPRSGRLSAAHGGHAAPRRRMQALLGAGTLVLFIAVAGAYVFYVRELSGGDARSARTEGPAPPPELAETDRMVRVVTDAPAGTPEEFFLDDRPLAGPTFRIAQGDRAAHSVRAVAGCRSAEAAVPAGSSLRELTLRLAPERARFEVASEPRGARVTVNGVAQDGQTPLTIEIDRCEDNRIAVTREGYPPATFDLNRGEDAAPLAARLSTIEFREPEAGSLHIERGPYDAQVFLSGKLLGRVGESLTAPAGTRTFEILNDSLFLRLKRSLSIKSSEQASWRPAWPALGSLTVQATPTNCSIHVKPSHESNFRYLDDVPVVNRRLAPGRYTIRCTLLTTHESQEKDVEVLPGKDESIDFTFLR